MYDKWLLQVWLKQQDSELINWSEAFLRRGWTESLLREYSEWIDWDVANKTIGKIFSLDFAREIRHKFSVEDGSVLTYKGIVIV